MSFFQLLHLRLELGIQRVRTLAHQRLAGSLFLGLVLEQRVHCATHEGKHITDPMYKAHLQQFFDLLESCLNVCTD